MLCACVCVKYMHYIFLFWLDQIDYITKTNPLYILFWIKSCNKIFR